MRSRDAICPLWRETWGEISRGPCVQPTPLLGRSVAGARALFFPERPPGSDDPSERSPRRWPSSTWHRRTGCRASPDRSARVRADTIVMPAEPMCRELRKHLCQTRFGLATKNRRLNALFLSNILSTRLPPSFPQSRGVAIFCGNGVFRIGCALRIGATMLFEFEDINVD